MRRYIKYLLPLFLLWACSFSSRPTYYIGVDPSFYASNFKGRENYVFGFIDDLLREIGEKEKVNFVRVGANWDNLLLGLKQKKYQGVVSPLRPNLLDEKRYSFSRNFLATGPVLIVRQDEMVSSFADLKNKEIAVAPGSIGMGLIESQPEVTMRTYESVANALADLVQGITDGVLVPALLAIPAIEDLYRGRLKIVTRPLTNEGLSIVCLKGREQELIEVFNRGVEQLQQGEEYQRLLSKWKIGFSSIDRDSKGKKGKKRQ